MSAYPPPTEDLPTFNPAVFFVDETGITLSEADARYLKLSGGIMTGTLAVPAITLNGSDVETDITALQTKTQDLTFSGNTSTFSGNIEATGNIYVSGNNKFIGVDNGTSSIKIQNHANHADFEVVNPDNAIHFKNAGTELFELTNTSTLFYQPLKANTSVDIGDGTTRFNTIYASTLNLPTISDVGSQITTNASNISTLQTKTTQLSYDSGTTTSTFGGSTLDVNATLALPLHSDVDSTLTTLESNVSTLQTKTTQLSYDSGTTTSTFGGSTLDVNATLALPLHADVDSTLTIIEGNVSTLQTKTTGISYDSGTTTTNISGKLATSDDITINQSNIEFLRADASVAGFINYQSEGLTLGETRGGNNTSIVIGGDDIVFKTNNTPRMTIAEAGTTTLTGTLALPSNSDVDTQLTTNTSNISTLQTKLTGISYSSGNDETDIDTNSGNFKLSIQNQGIKIEGDPATTDLDVIPLQGQTKGGLVQIRMLNRLGTGNSSNYHLYTNNYERLSSGAQIIDSTYKAQKLELKQPTLGSSNSTENACTWAFYSSTGSNPSPVGIIRFFYDGDIEANNVSHTSDKRLKENIIDANKENLISDFEKVRFVNYNFIGKERKELGVIGQELQKIYPSIGVERNNTDEDKKEDDLDSYLSVKYGVLNLKGLMVIQELIKENNELKERLNKIEEILNIN
jgi:hypothetical protein